MVMSVTCASLRAVLFSAADTETAAPEIHALLCLTDDTRGKKVGGCKNILADASGACKSR